MRMHGSLRLRLPHIQAPASMERGPGNGKQSRSGPGSTHQTLSNATWPKPTSFCDSLGFPDFMLPLRACHVQYGNPEGHAGELLLTDVGCIVARGAVPFCQRRPPLCCGVPLSSSVAWPPQSEHTHVQRQSSTVPRLRTAPFYCSLKVNLT